MLNLIQDLCLYKIFIDTSLFEKFRNMYQYQFGYRKTNKGKMIF